MPIFHLSMSRILSIAVEAENIETAIKFTENSQDYFDTSTEEDRLEYGARIVEMELMQQDIDDVSDIVGALDD